MGFFDKLIFYIIRYFTYLGNMFPQSLVLIYLAFIDFRKAYFVAGLWGWSYVLNLIIKNFVKRERPDPSQRQIKVSGYSFPSGHALTSTVLYFAIARYFNPGELYTYILYALPILLGLSRLYLGVHRAIDIICGWWFGYLFLYFGESFFNYVHQYFYDEAHFVFKFLKGFLFSVLDLVGLK